MTTTREGIADHKTLEHYHKARQRLERIEDIDPREVERTCWYMALRLARMPDGAGGYIRTYDHESAWEAADRIAALQRKGERP